MGNLIAALRAVVLAAPTRAAVHARPVLRGDWLPLRLRNTRRAFRALLGLVRVVCAAVVSPLFRSRCPSDGAAPSSALGAA